MPQTAARRLLWRAPLIAVAALAGLLAHPGSGAAANPQPTITLLSPVGNVVIQPTQTMTVFKWRIDWPTPPTENFTVTIQHSVDPAFALGSYTSENRTCRPTEPSCYTSEDINGVTPGKTLYWRITVHSYQTPDVVTAGSYKFTVAPDRVKPRVKALSGQATRGSDALFRVRVSDDRRQVRARATVAYRGRTVLTGAMSYAPVAWGTPLEFWSKRPLSRALPRGTYTFCVTVWDRAGNSAKSCAPYRVR